MLPDWIAQYANEVGLLVTVVGTIASIVGAIVSIRQARTATTQAQAAKTEAEAAEMARTAVEQSARKIRTRECARLLARALQEMSPLHLTGAAARGRDNNAVLAAVRREFDEACLVVSSDAPDRADLETAFKNVEIELDKAQAHAASGTISVDSLRASLKAATRMAKALADKV